MTRTPETAEEAEDLRGQLREFMAGRPDLSPIDLTQYTTLGECTGRAFLNGSLPGGKQVVSELQRVLEAAKAGDILEPGRGKVVVVSERDGKAAKLVSRSRKVYETETVRRVAEVLEYCVENATIGVITAPFGSGKSEAVKIWRTGRGRETQSLLFEFDEYSCANKVDFICQIAEILGLDGRPGNQQAGRMFRSVCDHLRSHPTLLIFDQVETVRPRLLQVIRQIWDRTREKGVGCVLLAAPVLLARMLASKMADFGALQSRVGIYAALNGVTKAEMSAIVKQEGICDVEESAFDLWWKAVGGSMRRLMRAIDMLKARHAGKRVTERTIVSLAGSLWGMNIATEAQTQGAW